MSVQYLEEMRRSNAIGHLLGKPYDIVGTPTFVSEKVPKQVRFAEMKTIPTFPLPNETPKLFFLHFLGLTK